MGCVLGALIQNGLAEREPPWTGMALIALSVASFFGFALLPSLARGIAWGIPAALFVSGWVFNERTRGTHRLPLLQLLGDASYAIYLSHVIVLSALFQLARHFAKSVPTEIAASVVITLTCIGAGVGVYWFIERPIINWFKTPRLKPAIAPAE